MRVKLQALSTAHENTTITRTTNTTIATAIATTTTSTTTTTTQSTTTSQMTSNNDTNDHRIYVRRQTYLEDQLYSCWIVLWMSLREKTKSYSDKSPISLARAAGKKQTSAPLQEKQCFLYKAISIEFEFSAKSSVKRALVFVNLCWAFRYFSTTFVFFMVFCNVVHECGST